MQISLRLLFGVITVSALDAAMGKYLLERRMLTNSLQGFCNSGLFIHVILLQVAGIALIASQRTCRPALARALIAGTMIGIVSLILSYEYSVILARWLRDHQSSLGSKWMAIEISVSLTALLGIPFLCTMATLIIATIWSAIRMNFLRDSYAYDCNYMECEPDETNGYRRRRRSSTLDLRKVKSQPR